MIKKPLSSQNGVMSNAIIPIGNIYRTYYERFYFSLMERYITALRTLLVFFSLKSFFNYLSRRLISFFQYALLFKIEINFYLKMSFNGFFNRDLFYFNMCSLYVKLIQLILLITFLINYNFK